MSKPRGHAFRALRSPNYRLFFGGQGVSLMGTWFTRYAMYRETYDLSHSALQLGLIAFCSQAPTAFLAPIAGVYADRWDRHRALVVTQVAAMLQSVALAAFMFSRTMTVWHIGLLAAVQAVINAFDMPVRQSFVRQMVEHKDDLPNAIALNSMLVNLSRMLGPVVAAVLADVFGLGWCFALDAASYLAVIGSLLAMNVAAQPARLRPTRVVEDLREGMRYVWEHRRVRDLLLLFSVSGTLGGAYIAMVPAIAAQLHGGGYAQGLLMGAAGFGALLGSYYLASRSSVEGLDGIVAWCGIVLGLAMLALEAAPNAWVAMPMLFAMGSSLVVQWSSTNTVAQSIVEDEKVGRVISLYAVVFFAGAPVGALVEGSLARAIGPIHTFALAGLACLVGSLVFRRGVARGAGVDHGASAPRSA